MRITWVHIQHLCSIKESNFDWELYCFLITKIIQELLNIIPVQNFMFSEIQFAE